MKIKLNRNVVIGLDGLELMVRVNLDIVTVELNEGRATENHQQIRLSRQTTAKDAGKINFDEIDLIK